VSRPWLAFLAVAACGGSGASSPDPFAASVEVPTQMPARAFAVLDDRAPRIALLFPPGATVGVLDADGGRLDPAVAAVGASPIAMAALDADGDGRRAVVTASVGDSSLALLAPGENGLVLRATATLPLAPKHVCAADLDGDGRDEAVVTVGRLGEATAVEPWRAAGGVLEPAGSRWPIDAVFATAAGDLDADGDVDVVAVRTSAGGIAWASNDGAGRLDEVARVSVCAAPRAAVVVAGAGAGSDTGDIAGAGSDTGETAGAISRIAVACDDGLALVTGADVDRLPVDGNVYDVAAGDFDRDGRTDLAAADLTADAVAVLRGLDGGGWSRPSMNPVGADPIAIAAADLGGDLDLDLVVLAFGGRTIDLLENVLAQQGSSP